MPQIKLLSVTQPTPTHTHTKENKLMLAITYLLTCVVPQMHRKPFVWQTRTPSLLVATQLPKGTQFVEFSRQCVLSHD